MPNSGEKISASDASYFFHRAITGDNKLKVPHGIGNISEADAVSYIQKEVEEKGLDAQRIVDGLRILAKDYKPFEFIYPAGIADGLKTALDGEKVPYAMQARGGAVVVSTRGRYAGKVSEVAGREVVRVLREKKGIEIPENLLPHVLGVVENLARREMTLAEIELMLANFLQEQNLGGENMAKVDVAKVRARVDALQKREGDLAAYEKAATQGLYNAVLPHWADAPKPAEGEALPVYGGRLTEGLGTRATDVNEREVAVTEAEQVIAEYLAKFEKKDEGKKE